MVKKTILSIVCITLGASTRGMELTHGYTLNNDPALSTIAPDQKHPNGCERKHSIKDHFESPKTSLVPKKQHAVSFNKEDAEDLDEMNIWQIYGFPAFSSLKNDDFYS